MYHYTYLITNRSIKPKKYYIGVRSCQCHPLDDTSYLGSSKYLTDDVEVKGIECFEKTILEIFDTRGAAMTHEIKLHESFDVENNELFYNKANASAEGFSWYGKHHSEETIEKIKAKRATQQTTESQIKKFKKTWQKKTEAQKEEYRQSRKTIWQSKTQAERDAFREKMSEISKTKWQQVSPEDKNKRTQKILDTKAKKSASEKEKEFVNRSKAQSAAKRNRSSEEINTTIEKRKQTYEQMSEEQLSDIRRKQSQQMKGRKWYNNGTVSKMFFEGNVPAGFTPGRKL